jgi:hypothetical protein
MWSAGGGQGRAGRASFQCGRHGTATLIYSIPFDPIRSDPVPGYLSLSRSSSLNDISCRSVAQTRLSSTRIPISTSSIFSSLPMRDVARVFPLLDGCLSGSAAHPYLTQFLSRQE